MTFMVFWVNEEGPKAAQFPESALSDCLNFMATLRKEKNTEDQPRNRFVTYASEHSDCVSLPGVSDQLPEGYDWSKQHRGAGPLPPGTPRTLA